MDELIKEMTVIYKKIKFLEASEKFREKMKEKDLRIEDLDEACH